MEIGLYTAEEIMQRHFHEPGLKTEHTTNNNPIFVT